MYRFSLGLSSTPLRLGLPASLSRHPPKPVVLPPQLVGHALEGIHDSLKIPGKSVAGGGGERQERNRGTRAGWKHVF